MPTAAPEQRGRPANIPVAKIRADSAIQARCRLNDQAVADYADAIARGERMPAVVVFNDGSTYWLADGFHRLEAVLRSGKDEITAKVIDGSREDAAWYALGANRTHGVRMTREDKERAIGLALTLHPGDSNRVIADHIGVSDETVRKLRVALAVDDGGQRIGRDGKSYPSVRQVPNSDTWSAPDSKKNDDEPPPLVVPQCAVCGRSIYGVPPHVCDDCGSVMHPVRCNGDHQCSAKSASAPVKPGPGQVKAAPPKRPVDKVGHEIPLVAGDSIAEAFRRDHELVELCTAVSRIKSKVTEYFERDDPLIGDMNVNQTKADLVNAYAAIEHCRPFAVCPYCGGAGGDGCQACKRRGWVNKTTWDHRPKEATAV